MEQPSMEALVTLKSGVEKVCKKYKAASGTFKSLSSSATESWDARDASVTSGDRILCAASYIMEAFDIRSYCRP